MANRFKRNRFGMQISSRKLLSVVTLLSGTLAWFFLVNTYFLDIFAGYSADNFWIYLGLVLFYGVMVLSAIVGSSVSERVNRKNILVLWIIFGIAATALVAMFHGAFFVLILSILLGISFGFGFPSSAALLADSTAPEERAKISGITILATFMLTFLGIIIISMLNLGLIEILLLFVAIRSVSLIGWGLDKCERKTGKKQSWISVISFRAFASYIIPWVLLNAAAGLLTWSNIPKTPEYVDVIAIYAPLTFLSIAVFGLISGFVADRFGRKQPIIISLVMLGLSFGLLSVYLAPLTLLIHYIIYGVAWGFFFPLYLAVPGDLSNSGSREKFYALGTMTPWIGYMALSAIPQFLPVSLSASLLSPILSIILFLSVIPVARASETLPERAVRKRKLDQHLKKLGELIEQEDTK